MRSCICALAQTVPHQVELLILMHPQEVNEAKGTGHLLHLCLPHSRLLVGEAFDADTLNAALHNAWDDEAGKPRTACCSTLTPRSKMRRWAC